MRYLMYSFILLVLVFSQTASSTFVRFAMQKQIQFS